MKVRTVILAAVVMGTTFVALPFGMIGLNDALGWPRWQSTVARVSGVVLMLTGLGLALYCSQLFSKVGEGTPVPTEPPKRLVLAGVYRYSRNPIYVADVAMLLGLFLFRGELTLLFYAALFALAAHGWVVWHEEPVLLRRFGEAYERYMRSVPRWVVF